MNETLTGSSDVKSPLHQRGMALLQRVRQFQQKNLKNFIPFYCESQALGWIPLECLSWFQQVPEVFECAEQSISLHPGLQNPDSRTRAVAEVLKEWETLGRIPGGRDDGYRVSSRYTAEPVFFLERAAASLFGITSYGVHLNGIAGDPENKLLWLARRAKDRPQYPGAMDHLVAGGLTAGISADQVMIRECFEEAGIPEQLACKARPCGQVSLFMEYRGRIKRDLLFCYDLILPEDFVPCNKDGEVESFFKKNFSKVEALIAETEEIKLNCNLVMLDFLIRYGQLNPEMPFYTEIVNGLRSMDVQ